MRAGAGLAAAEVTGAERGALRGRGPASSTGFDTAAAAPVRWDGGRVSGCWGPAQARCGAAGVLRTEPNPCGHRGKHRLHSYRERRPPRGGCGSPGRG